MATGMLERRDSGGQHGKVVNTKTFHPPHFSFELAIAT